jgi:hypothetical protein
MYYSSGIPRIVLKDDITVNNQNRSTSPNMHHSSGIPHIVLKDKITVDNRIHSTGPNMHYSSCIPRRVLQVEITVDNRISSTGPNGLQQRYPALSHYDPKNIHMTYDKTTRRARSPMKESFNCDCYDIDIPKHRNGIPRRASKRKITPDIA